MAYYDTVFYVNGGNGTSTGYYGVTPWAATTAVTAGVFRRQLATPAVGNARCFVCIVAGTTGGSEPTWVLTRGALTAADGTVTWQECTGMAAPNEATQTNAPTWATVKGLVVSIGEVIYDSGSASLQIASVPGTAGSGSTPSFSATAGVTTTDNMITWTSLGLASGFTGWQYPHSRTANAEAAGWNQPAGTIYVSNHSAETQSSITTLKSQAATFSTTLMGPPTNILCVNDSAAPPTALATGATLTNTSGGFLFNGFDCAYYNSLSFVNSSSSVSTISSGNSFVFDICNFTFGSSSSLTFIIGGNVVGAGTFAKFNSCSFVFGNAAQTIEPLNGYQIFSNCSFAASGTVPTNLFSGSANASASTVIVRDCDLSNINTNLVLASTTSGSNFAMPQGQFIFENCKLNGSVAIANGLGAAPYGTVIRLRNCDSGNTNYRFYDSCYLGTCQNENTIVRSGGASSFGTGISWKLISSVHASFAQPYFTSPPYGEDIQIPNIFTSGSHTATIYLTSNTRLYNNMFWIDVECLGTSGYPLGVVTSSKMAWLGTPVELTVDGGSSWGGGALTYLYKVAVSYSPTEIGILRVRLNLQNYLTATTVYVDPLPILA